ncbi:TPA: hypothetical protein ACYSE7_000713 [Raoultella ornithinolytica]
MTDITELALIAKIKKQLENFDTVVLKEGEAVALVEALEKTQAKADIYDMLRDDYGLREKGVGLTDFVDWQAKRIAELESRTVTVKLPKPHAHLIWIQAGHAPDDYWDDVAVSHSEKDRCCDGSERYPVYARWEIEEMLTAAGIKVEAE